MRFATKAVRAGQRPDPTTGSILVPIYQTSTYVLEELGKNKGYDYSRTGNPTRQALEENIAALENAKHAVVFSSGMAAVSAVAGLLTNGDHVVSSDDIYGGVYRLFEQVLRRYGLTFTYVDTRNPDNVKGAMRPETKMVWIETPSNPLLKISDIESIAKVAKSSGALLAVDSTFMTPYFLRPLEFGADIAVHSTTKFLSGHNQLIGGAAATSDAAIYEKLKFLQNSVGAVPGPLDCWLTLLGIKTLHLRMECHNENAMRIASFLHGHKKIERVIYPGLQTHQQHDLAIRQMSGFGGIVSFEPKGGSKAAKKFVDSLKLCYLAESLGGTETMVTHPATMTHSSVPRDERIKRGITDSMVRISVGLEDAEDITEDLKQALAKT